MPDFEHTDVSVRSRVDKRFGAPPESVTERRLLVSLLDLSASMNEMPTAEDGSELPDARIPIDELNQALHAYLKDELRKDQEFALKGEIAVGGFWGNSNVEWMELGIPVRPSSKIYWVRYISETADLDFELKGKGGTPLGRAVSMALDLVEEELQYWNKIGKRGDHRPIVVVLTDGLPTDMRDFDTGVMLPDFQRLIDRTHRMEAENNVLLWIAFTAGADDKQLLPLADKGNLIPLGDKGISSFITLMSKSPNVASVGGNRTATEIYAELRRQWDRDMR